jgi:hypothetical protein
MGTKHYVEILKTIGEEGASWSKIKRYLELRLETKIYDSEFARFLKNSSATVSLRKETVCI